MTDRLNRIEAGSSALPTVVLLHGFGGSSDGWAAIMDQIKPHAYVIAFDLPGHAGSLTYPDFGSPRVAALAVAHEMHRLGIERFHIVGHSMGGAVAALIALNSPDRVLSLTLLAPGGFGFEINATLMKAFAMAATPDALRTSFTSMFGQGAIVSEAAVLNVMAMRNQNGQMDALALILNKIMREGKQGRLPLEEIAVLAVPVNILWGDDDQVVPVSQLIEAPSQFGKTILPGAGHMLIDERPMEVIRSILEQLG